MAKDGDSCGLRSLALLDSIGFRGMIRQNGAAGTGALMKRLLKDVALFAKNPYVNPESAGQVQFLIYSDSILLYTEEEGASGLLSVIKQAGEILGFAMNAGIPLRGAVTRGDLFVSGDRQVFAGPGLVRAYDLEQQQKWGGAIIDPRLVTDGSPDEKQAIDMALTAYFVRPYEVPMQLKNQPLRLEPHLAVDWTKIIGGDVDSAWLRNCMMQTLGEPDESGRAKQEATLEFWKADPDPQATWDRREEARNRAVAWYKRTGEWTTFHPAYQKLLSKPLSYRVANGKIGPIPGRGKP